jgi:RimJ/RimL family protein N-acetyltransferase
MSKLEKSNKIFNFKVVSKFFYFEPINKKYLNKKYLNWLNNPNINRFLSSVTKRNTTKDLYEKINSLRKNNGELFSIHKKKDSIHIGNLTISNFKKNNSITYGLMIGDKKSQEVGAGGYVILMFASLSFDYLKCKKIFAGCKVDNYKSINTLKTIGFSSKGIKNNFEYFELSNNKWKKIKLNFLVKNLKIKIHYK